MAVVRKSEFAKLCNVSKPRVTQWIAEGKLTPPALIGEGISQRIDVELGMAQVDERRAVDESYGLNGLDKNLKPPAPNLPVPEARESKGQRAPLPGDKTSDGPEPAPRIRLIPEGETDGTVEARIKAEKLKQAEFLTNRLKAEDEARRGKYMDAQEATGEMTRVADEMLKIFEGAALGAISSARMAGDGVLAHLGFSISGSWSSRRGTGVRYYREWAPSATEALRLSKLPQLDQQIAGVIRSSH